MSKRSLQNSYADAFHQFMVGGLQQSLIRVKSTKSVPSEQHRMQACHVLDLALGHPEIWPEAKPLLLELSPAMEQVGQYADWLPIIRRGIEMSVVVADAQAEGELRVLAGWFFGHLGRLDEAGAELEQAIGVLRSLDTPHTLGRALNRLALIERRRRQSAAARGLATEALEILPTDASERANCYVVLGELAMDMHEWPEAEMFARLTYTIWSEAGDRRRTAWALRNLSPALFEQGKREEAIRSLLEAVEILEAENDPVQLAVTRMNLGNVHRLSGALPQALPLFDAAELTLRHARDEVSLAMLYVNRGAAHRELGNWYDAESDLQTSIALWKRMGNLHSRLNAMDELALLYHATGEVAEAVTITEEALGLLPEDPASRHEFESVRDTLVRHLARFEEDFHKPPDAN